MTIEELREFALSLPCATEDVKWEKDLCFCVGAKMFCVTFTEGNPASASFKVKSELFDELCERVEFEPAPYLARYKWVLVRNTDKVSKKELMELIRISHQLVGTALPAKTKKEIGWR